MFTTDAHSTYVTARANPSPLEPIDLRRGLTICKEQRYLFYQRFDKNSSISTFFESAFRRAAPRKRKSKLFDIAFLVKFDIIGLSIQRDYPMPRFHKEARNIFTDLS